jgi:hypothetical protein
MQFSRATSAEFGASFLDIDGEPLPCANPTIYPSIAIKDPSGITVSTGVGRLIGGGKYTFRWFVPPDAELNTPDRPWSISWFFVTETGHNKDFEESFNVTDRVEPEPEERKWTYLTRIGKSERLFLPLMTQPEELGLDILDGGDNAIVSIYPTNDTVTDDIALASPKIPISNRKIGRIARDGRYHYVFDTDPLTSIGDYLVFWRVRETVVSPEDEVQQLLRVPEMNFWRLLQPLRMLIDKLQKRIGWVQAYADSDLYDYILHGVGLANVTQPTTNWTLSSIPIQASRGVIDVVLLYAAVWGLIAQQTSEIELQFDHSGQTVTLNYNHDYGNVLGYINDLLEKFAESKQHIYRIAHGPGYGGVSPKNWRFNQRVWRVDNWGSGSPYDASVLLTSIGL